MPKITRFGDTGVSPAEKKASEKYDKPKKKAKSKTPSASRTKKLDDTRRDWKVKGGLPAQIRARKAKMSEY